MCLPSWPTRIEGGSHDADAVAPVTVGTLEANSTQLLSSSVERRPFSRLHIPENVRSQFPTRLVRPTPQEVCRLGWRPRGLPPSTRPCCSPHQQSLQIPPPGLLCYLGGGSPGLPAVSPDVQQSPYLFSSGPRFTLICRPRNTSLQVSYKPGRERREARRRSHAGG